MTFLQSSEGGRHTTTFAQLLPLKFGGFVVDTPGFADLTLLGIDKDEIKLYFPEFCLINHIVPFLTALMFMSQIVL